MVTITRRRWSDNDRYFGPFTYAKDGAYRRWSIILQSGDDEYPGCSLRFSGFSRTLIIALPPIIKPWLEEFGEPVDPEMAARIGRRRHYHTHPREFGFSLSGSGRIGSNWSDFLQIKYGAQTHDSRTDASWGYFLPWLEWRHVRHSLYDLSGNHYWTDQDKKAARLGHRGFDEWRAAKDNCPSATFKFADYDGEALTARTIIEEREWRAGEGWFKWLSIFRKPKIGRSLDITFSGETGSRKGSWKGGTIGHSIEMHPGELHESAFRRYCAEHEMAFIGRLT